MIVLLLGSYSPGKKVMITWHAGMPHGQELGTPQPAIVLRKATREEFISFWSSQSPELFEELCKSGLPPECDRYYEVSTD